MKRTLLGLLLVLLVAGCGGGDDEATTTDTGTTTTAPAETTPLGVYFLYEDKVWPVLREVAETDAGVTAALEELFAGPTDEEEVQFGFSTAIPEGVELESVTAEGGGVVQVELSEDLPPEALAQVVYTASRPVDVHSVEVGGKSYTRDDFEDLTPAILVEWPLAFQRVGNPVEADGEANTFEATFQYELTDTDGRIVDKNFVTATSGSGTRGTFSFTTKEYDIPFDGVGALIVYEISAKDGSRINLREIPVRMSK